MAKIKISTKEYKELVHNSAQLTIRDIELSIVKKDSMKLEQSNYELKEEISRLNKRIEKYEKEFDEIYKE